MSTLKVALRSRIDSSSSRSMVPAWALKGLPCHNFWAYVHNRKLHESFGPVQGPQPSCEQLLGISQLLLAPLEYAKEWPLGRFVVFWPIILPDSGGTCFGGSHGRILRGKVALFCRSRWPCGSRGSTSLASNLGYRHAAVIHRRKQLPISF